MLMLRKPQWHPLKSKRKGGKKKESMVSGEIQMQYAIADPSNPSALPEEILRKFMALVASSPDDDVDDHEELGKLDSRGVDDDDDEEDDNNELETSDETDDPTKPEVAEKRKKKLRLARLKRKTKARAYEFTGGSDVVGIAFIEIGRITDLPPERNGMYSPSHSKGERIAEEDQSQERHSIWIHSSLLHSAGKHTVLESSAII